MRGFDGMRKGSASALPFLLTMASCDDVRPVPYASYACCPARAWTEWLLLRQLPERGTSDGAAAFPFPFLSLLHVEHQSLEVFALGVVDVDRVVGGLRQLVQDAHLAARDGCG